MPSVSWELATTGTNLVSFAEPVNKQDLYNNSW